MVQLAIGMKRKITSMVKDCCLSLNGLQTKVDLYVIPLGSYDVFIGMDWLDAHFVVVDFHNKMIMCLNDSGN